MNGPYSVILNNYHFQTNDQVAGVAMILGKNIQSKASCMCWFTWLYMFVFGIATEMINVVSNIMLIEVC